MLQIFSQIVLKTNPMFSHERKALVLRAYQQFPPTERSARHLSKLFNVSKSTVHRWIKAYVGNHSIEEQGSEDLKVTKLDTILQYIDEEIIKDPFQTCKMLKQFLKEHCSIIASLELIRLGIKKLGYTKKTARYYGVAKNALYLNKTFLKKRDEYIKSGARLYSIDETGFGRFSYQRRTGYSKAGEQLMIRKEKARVTSTTVLACASSDGWVSRSIFKGATNRKIFSEFILSLEMPTGSVILLDNASIHKGDQVFDAFKQKGFIPLYVPPYSPWYNPIEKCFSIVKYLFSTSQNIEKSFDLLDKEQHFVPFFRNTLRCYGMNGSDASRNIDAMNTVDEIETTDVVNQRKKIRNKRHVVEKSKPEETKKTTKTRKVDADGSITTTTTTVTTIVTLRIRRPVNLSPKLEEMA